MMNVKGSALLCLWFGLNMLLAMVIAASHDNGDDHSPTCVGSLFGFRCNALLTCIHPIVLPMTKRRSLRKMHWKVMAVVVT